MGTFSLNGTTWSIDVGDMTRLGAEYKRLGAKSLLLHNLTEEQQLEACLKVLGTPWPWWRVKLHNLKLRLTRLVA